LTEADIRLWVTIVRIISLHFCVLLMFALQDPIRSCLCGCLDVSFRPLCD
jgi:hypothetical protein